MKKDLSPLNEADYEAIEAAVMETERGRWFLARYAERNRNSDTTVLLEAIGKLERSMQDNRTVAAAGDVEQVRFDLVEMAAAIAQTKREIASLQPEGGEDVGINGATEELDAIVTATETATQEILESAENIQELTWTMREAGVDEEYCEQIDNLITAVYTACSFQDITGQRTSKVVAVLHYLEERLDAMRHIWGGEEADAPAPRSTAETRPDAHLLNGPQLDGDGHSQDDIDLMMGSRQQLFDAVVSPSEDDEPAEAMVTELVTDDAVIEFSEEEVTEEPVLEFEEEAYEDAEFEEEDAAAGQMIMVSKPQADADISELDQEASDEANPASPLTSGELGDHTDTLLLNKLGDDEKLALFS